MSPASTTTTAAFPQEGDVVISYVNGYWEFGTHAQPPGARSKTRDGALAVVRAFATKQRVDVWVTRDRGTSFDLAIRAPARSR